jgi:DNA-binding response OmpR family regulator
MTMADRAIRILVVEDCPAAAEQLRTFLAPPGFDVQVAGDPSAGFIRAIWFRPAVVLVAMDLAGPVGLRLPKLLRCQAVADVPRVIAATGPDGPTARLAARVAGFDAFLPKPFDWDRLRDLLLGPRTPAPA